MTVSRQRKYPLPEPFEIQEPYSWPVSKWWGPIYPVQSSSDIPLVETVDIGEFCSVVAIDGESARIGRHMIRLGGQYSENMTPVTLHIFSEDPRMHHLTNSILHKLFFVYLDLVGGCKRSWCFALVVHEVRGKLLVKPGREVRLLTNSATEKNSFGPKLVDVVVVR